MPILEFGSDEHIFSQLRLDLLVIYLNEKFENYSRGVRKLRRNISGSELKCKKKENKFT